MPRKDNPKSSKFFLFFLFVFLLFWSISPGCVPGAKMKNGPDLILRKQDGGKQFTIKTGDAIQVLLEGTGGTGYWWYVLNLDKSHLQLLSEDTQTASDGRVGGPVVGAWNFRATQPGTTEIRLDYYRSWEGSARAIDHFTVKLKIE